jgi:phosphatidylinositol dimannoside acyltransferase
VRPHDVFRWKTYFYDVLLPALRWLGPERADAWLARLGRLSALAWPPYRRRLAASLARLSARDEMPQPTSSVTVSDGRPSGIPCATGSASALPASRTGRSHWQSQWHTEERQTRLRTSDGRTTFTPGASKTPPQPPRSVGVADLAAGSFRFLARDYLLETADDAAVLARFDVTGGSAVDDAMAAGRGAILVGGHLGGHLAAFHWLYRRGVPLRVMVQRPSHVSRALADRFDRDGPDPQSGYFLRRGLGPTDCVERLLRARAAVRSGKAVYFAGDIPWTGPNTRAGRLLGQPHRFLAVWADLSALTGAPVIFTFCTHRLGGRFDLRFEPIGRVPRGGEDAAVAAFLARLEAAIAAHPSDAVAHLTWPCYGPPVPAQGRLLRPGRRAAEVAWEGV